MDKEAPGGGKRSGISTRSMEIVVALLMFTLGAIVVLGSYRLGARWSDDGPQSGYFPFYIGLLNCISCVVNLAQALVFKPGTGELFVERGPLMLVLTMLIPAAVYALGIQFLGLYIASAIYISSFMILLGNYSWLRSLCVGFGVNAGFFLMFEVWFKVPLFKGSLDPLRFLGY
jgi:hypothetical protein